MHAKTGSETASLEDGVLLNNAAGRYGSESSAMINARESESSQGSALFYL